jgi:hypothetical protein
MKSGLAFTFIVCLVGSALPLAAQVRFVERTSGPIARSVVLEAARLAFASRTDPDDPNWARVRNLTPGTEIILTRRTGAAIRAYFLSADESGITVLDAADPTFPAAVRLVLLDVVANHPDYFADAQNGRRFLFDNDVSLASDGLFFAGRKVADLGQVFERTARIDVYTVRRGSGRQHPAAWGALVGAVVGAAVELVSFGAGCGHDGCLGNALLVTVAGIGAGAGAGVSVAISAARHSRTRASVSPFLISFERPSEKPTPASTTGGRIA